MKKPKHSTISSRHLPYRKIADFAMVGSSSALVLVALLGCDNPRERDDFVNNSSSQSSQSPQQAIKQGAFVIVEEQLDGSYKVLEEYPSATTRVVVRDKSGTERILSDEEVNEIIQKEATRVENGTSELLAPAGSGGGESGGGLGLGGAILASAAGALLGSYIGNKLFNNPNYQQNKQRTYKSPQAYERSANNFKQGSANTPRAGTTPNNAKSGFYQNNAAKGAPSPRPAQGGFSS